MPKIKNKGKESRARKWEKWLERNNKIAGAACALLIFLFYFGIITFANSFSHAILQFSRDWYWIIALSAGLGLQVFLHFKLKHELSKKALTAKGLAATSGVSGAAMLACCAHHISDALPFLGLAFFAGFFYEYRDLFLLFGVLSNFVGIAYILKMYNLHGVESGFPSGIQKLFKTRKSVNFSIIGSAAVFLSYLARFFILR